MSHSCAWVSPATTLAEIAREHVAGYGHTCFFVGEDGQLQGVFTVREMREHPASAWIRLTAVRVMLSLDCKPFSIDPAS